MKRTIYLGALALAALTMTNCSNDESVYSAATETQKAIGFETYATRPNQGRGLPTTGTTIQTSSFGVIAYETTEAWTNAKAPSFMYNQKVTYDTDNTKWVYTPVQLWPETNKISFFSYAPFATKDNRIELSAKAENDPSLTYTLTPATPAKMIDIVAAQAKNQTYDDSSSGKVTFTFGHILSRIGFGVKTTDLNDVRVVVTGMELTVSEGSRLYSKATYNMNSKKWIYEGGTQSTTNLALPGTLNTASVTTLTGYTGTGLLLKTTKADPFKSEDTHDNYWYLIPTKENYGMDLSKFSVKFTYDLVTSIDNGANWTCDEGQKGLTKTIKLDSSEKKTLDLVAGNAHDFVFTIGPKVISFDATLSDWSTSTDGEIGVK